MLSFDEAVARVVEMAREVGQVGAERVSLFESDGRILVEDVVAQHPLPGFDYSAMDGYAVRAADFAPLGTDRALRVAGETAAGDAAVALAPHTAQRIFTGAPLPVGADAVVMQEDTAVEVRDGARFVVFKAEAPRAGAHVRKKGEDIAEGAIAIARGTRLDPGKVALAAALDHATLTVSRRPVVTILGTGDELRSPGDPPRAGSIVESNGFFVAGAARRAGATVRLAPFVRDDPAEATRAVARALVATDVLVTIGGVSVGDHDVVRPALEAAGVKIDFYKVAMKPGKPLTVGRTASGTVVLGLPGNPASASLTFVLFGVPLLRALAGERETAPPALVLPVEGALSRKPGRTEFARARLVTREQTARAVLLSNQSSGAVTSFAEAELLLKIPAERGSVADGDVLEAIDLRAMLRG
ncbi:MAG: gephyrin-like molybdotransferase Glp [Polyangiaceae bacterium]